MTSPSRLTAGPPLIPLVSAALASCIGSSPLSRVRPELTCAWAERLVGDQATGGRLPHGQQRRPHCQRCVAGHLDSGQVGRLQLQQGDVAVVERGGSATRVTHAVPVARSDTSRPCATNTVRLDAVFAPYSLDMPVGVGDVEQLVVPMGGGPAPIDPLMPTPKRIAPQWTP